MATVSPRCCLTPSIAPGLYHRPRIYSTCQIPQWGSESPSNSHRQRTILRAASTSEQTEQIELTEENVEKVLDEVGLFASCLLHG